MKIHSKWWIETTGNIESKLSMFQGIFYKWTGT